MICFRDQFVDQLWRPLAPLQVRLDGGERDFGQHECGAAQLTRTGAAKGAARKCPQAGLETLSLIGDAAPERRRPVALNEIVAAVEHEQPRVVQMPARPGRRVERGAEAIARLDRGDETLLIGEHGLEPHLAKQRIARGEAIIERTLGRFQPLGDRIDVTD